jgi:hypothetical protein
MTTPLAAFGPGIIILQNVTQTTPAPINVGYANEFSIDLSASTKQLYGQKQFPLAAARGTVKATGKIKAATLSGLAWNAAFFGQSMAAGGFQWNVDEAHTMAGTTVQVTNHSTFDADLGVRYAATNLPLQRVAAGSETTGYYSVSTSTGIYTVSSGDNAAGLLLTYSNTTTGGQSLTVANQLIGNTPVFQLDYYTNLNQPTAKPFAIRLYAAVASKFTLASKLEDFVMPEIDFEFYANAAGNVYEMVFPEVS